MVDGSASTCDSESAGAGRLIDGGARLLFLGMINGGNTMLLHLAGQGLAGQLDKHLAVNQQEQADCSTMGIQRFF